MDYRFAGRMAEMKPSSIREILKLTEKSDVISFAGGLPAPELFPVDDIRTAAERALSALGPQALQYGQTDGAASLREMIAADMSTRGVDCGIDDILVTTGSQQAIDLIGKILLDPGDVILTENPTYLAAIQSFQCFQARFQPVPTDADGIIPEAVDELAGHRHCRFLYVIPNFQNPTGRTLPSGRRRALYDIAVRRNFLIVEDDPYGRLRYRGHHVPPIKSFDRTGHVIYMSTFSKTVAPGFRTGWIVAAKDVRAKLIVAKQASDLHTSSFDQLVLDRYLRDFDNVAHVERVRKAYGERFAAMNEALRERMDPRWEWTHPEGGMFLWVKGPASVDTAAVLERSLREKVAFVPGADFFPERDGRNFMRLNFSNANIGTIREGIARLAKICAEVTGESELQAPAGSAE
jgi:2-aminoadipate transaminase